MAGLNTDEVRILLVDDEEDLRYLIRRRLERTGWCTIVGEASSTAEAIEAAAAEQPDVILLDLLLGSERGTDAIGRLLQAAPGAMVAVLTVLLAEEEESTSRAAGAFTFYEKTMLSDLATHLRDDLDTFSRALQGESVVAPAATTRRPS